MALLDLSPAHLMGLLVWPTAPPQSTGIWLCYKRMPNLLLPLRAMHRLEGSWYLDCWYCKRSSLLVALARPSLGGRCSCIVNCCLDDGLLKVSRHSQCSPELLGVYCKFCLLRVSSTLLATIRVLQDAEDRLQLPFQNRHACVRNCLIFFCIRLPNA